MSYIVYNKKMNGDAAHLRDRRDPFSTHFISTSARAI
jgi:hypothetical protein